MESEPSCGLLQSLSIPGRTLSEENRAAALAGDHSPHTVPLVAHNDRFADRIPDSAGSLMEWKQHRSGNGDGIERVGADSRKKRSLAMPPGPDLARSYGNKKK
jgi:hypothetical protein